MSCTILIKSYHATPEHEEITNVYTIFSASRVLNFDEVQYFYLCFSLVGILLVIFHDLQSNQFISLIVHALVHFPEGALTQLI